MPPIYYLNPPPNPFWDFVTDMQSHPFFHAYARPPHPENPDAAGTAAGTTRNPNTETTNVEDPPEVDPSTLTGGGEQAQETHELPYRGRGRFPGACGEEGGRTREGHERRGRGRHGRGGFEHHPAGPPPFPFGRGGWFWGPRGPRGPHGPPPFSAPSGEGPHPPEDRWRRGGPPHHHRHGPPRPHGHHGHRGPSPPHGGPGPRGFDLGRFLNDLGSRIGVDLQGAAQGFGLDRAAPSNADADFEPKVDIFDREQDYVLHLSLPGAKKEDVGVDWDGEHSLLRVAGVVHRPEVDEKMLTQLIVDGRKRETGVFEKHIRLGTRREPATIDVAGIKAKMTDGVLIITLPKGEKRHEKREVPIGNSQTPSPQRGQYQTMFDADQEMWDTEPEIATPVLTPAPASAPVPVPQQQQQEKPQPVTGKSEVSKGKQAEYEKEKEVPVSPSTVQGDQLPTYTPTAAATADEHDGSDWEHFVSDDEGEGEYIKINVD